MNEKTRKFCETMLTYVVDNNWNNVDRANSALPEKYAVLIALSFSVVIKTEYTPRPIPGEICRVPIDEHTDKQSLLKAFLEEMEK